MGSAAALAERGNFRQSSLAANGGEGLAYRAINPQFAESTAANGFYRSGAAGRLGNDGIYANSTIEGAIAEFAHHNPGISPAVFEVRYPISTPLRIDPPSGYFNQPLPFTQGANILEAPSVRAPSTTNWLIREGAVPGNQIR
jgi:hypothetical protein